MKRSDRALAGPAIDIAETGGDLALEIEGGAPSAVGGKCMWQQMPHRKSSQRSKRRYSAREDARLDQIAGVLDDKLLAIRTGSGDRAGPLASLMLGSTTR